MNVYEYIIQGKGSFSGKQIDWQLDEPLAMNDWKCIYDSPKDIREQNSSNPFSIKGRPIVSINLC